MLVRLTREALPDACDSRDETRQPYGSSTSEPLVYRLCEPTSNQGTGEIWGRVNEAKGPAITLRLWVGNVEVHFVEALGAVHDCLVHSLDGSTESLLKESCQCGSEGST